MSGDTVPQVNAMPPLPALAAISHWERDEDGQARADGVTIEPQEACEIPAAWLSIFRWMMAVTPDGHLVFRAINGSHVFRVVGLNRDHQGLLYLRLEWLDTLDADPPPMPEHIERRHRPRWEHVDGEFVKVTYADEPPEVTQEMISAAHDLLHDIAPADRAKQVHDLIDGLVWELNWERDQRRHD